MGKSPRRQKDVEVCCSPASLSPASNHPKPKPKPKPAAPDGWRWRRVPGRISIRNPGWHWCLWQNGGGNEYEGQKLPYPGDCHKYYRCIKSTIPGHDFEADVYTCGDWAFDPNQSSCVWDDIDNDLCDA